MTTAISIISVTLALGCWLLLRRTSDYNTPPRAGADDLANAEAHIDTWDPNAAWLLNAYYYNSQTSRPSLPPRGRDR